MPGELHLTSQNAIVEDRKPTWADALLPCKVLHGPTGWSSSGMMIAWSGPPGCRRLRLPAERTGLRAGVSTATARRGFDPVHDRGRLLLDLALTQIPGGEAISDFQGLRHSAPVIGEVPSTPTVRRALNEVGDPQPRRLNPAVTAFR